MLYVVMLPVRTLEYIPIFTILHVYLLFSHVIFMSVLSSLNGSFSCSLSSDYSVSFPPFFSEQVLNVLNCVILIVWYMCLKEQQEVATEVNPGSSPYVWGRVTLPLWDYPSASHLSSYHRLMHTQVPIFITA